MKLLKNAIFGIMLVLSAFIFSPLVNAETVYFIQQGQELEFPSNGEDKTTVWFTPYKQGTWQFTTWHATSWYWDKIAAVAFYWRDLSEPGAPWHNWRNVPVGFLWPRADQTLYAGSGNIEFKFEFTPFDPVLLGIHVLIE